jgi:hypothetical protein
MKLKLAAAAALVALSGAANATIDNGATGNGELFFSVWDANSSYTRDLNITLNSFESAVAAAGAYLNQVSADALFTSFLSTVDLGTMKWAITAADNSGARRILDTYAVIPTDFNPLVNQADSARTAVGNLVTHVNALNTYLTSSDSAIYAVSDAGYAGKVTYGDNSNNKLIYNRTGSVANGSYESGLNIMRVNFAATGIAAPTYTPYTEDGAALRAFLDLNQGSATFGQLTIAAPVPEPESYAMLLAGLGVMGAIARRRRNKQA